MIRRLAAVMTVAYVAGAGADLVLAALSPEGLTRAHRAADGVAPRLLVALMAATVVAYALAGAVRAATDLWPAAARHRAGAAAGVRFLSLAAGIPLAATVLWPAMTAWWAR